MRIAMRRGRKRESLEKRLRTKRKGGREEIQTEQVREIAPLQQSGHVRGLLRRVNSKDANGCSPHLAIDGASEHATRG
jgi:hypothetical protein